MATSKEDRTGAFVPAEVFPPGEIIRMELAARDWTQSDLAEVMERPVQLVGEIIRGKKRVTEETARELEAALGIEAEFWVRTEALYRLHQVAPITTATRQRAEIRTRVPLRYMHARGWLKMTADVETLSTDVLRYLGVSSLSDSAPFAVAAKQTTYGGPLSATQEVWLLRVKQIAESMIVPDFSRAKLLEAANRMQNMLASAEDVRHVPSLLSGAGVRFVVVERLPGLKIDGVCFWLRDNTQPVIGLSLTANRIDNFWFVVRHEIEHVLNGDGRNGAIIDNELESADATTEQERLANAAAAEFCVSQSALQGFIDRKAPLFTDDNIRFFALTQRRHPGLVAGQLRRRLGAWNKYMRHLEPVRDHVLSTALFDGFGSVLEFAT